MYSACRVLNQKTIVRSTNSNGFRVAFCNRVYFESNQGVAVFREMECRVKERRVCKRSNHKAESRETSQIKQNPDKRPNINQLEDGAPIPWRNPCTKLTKGIKNHPKGPGDSFTTGTYNSFRGRFGDRSSSWSPSRGRLSDCLLGLLSEATAVEVDARESGERATRAAEGTAVPDGVLQGNDNINVRPNSKMKNDLTIDNLFCVQTSCSSRTLARHLMKRIRHMICTRRCAHQKYPLEHHSRAAASFQQWQRDCLV